MYWRWLNCIKNMLFQTIGAFRLIFKKLSSTKKHSNFTDAVLKYTQSGGHSLLSSSSVPKPNRWSGVLSIPKAGTRVQFQQWRPTDIMLLLFHSLLTYFKDRRPLTSNRSCSTFLSLVEQCGYNESIAGLPTDTIQNFGRGYSKVYRTYVLCMF